MISYIFLPMVIKLLQYWIFDSFIDVNALRIAANFIADNKKTKQDNNVMVEIYPSINSMIMIVTVINNVNFHLIGVD